MAASRRLLAQPPQDQAHLEQFEDMDVNVDEMIAALEGAVPLKKLESAYLKLTGASQTRALNVLDVLALTLEVDQRWTGCKDTVGVLKAPLKASVLDKFKSNYRRIVKALLADVSEPAHVVEDLYVESAKPCSVVLALCMTTVGLLFPGASQLCKSYDTSLMKHLWFRAVTLRLDVK
eukprot:scaffold207_cov409-Prasinococcus_capsulatus_cf.AAC.115